MTPEEKRIRRNEYARKWREAHPGYSSPYTNKHYHENKEKRLACSKRWAQANKEHVAAQQKKWRKKDHKHSAIISSRARAKQRGLEFSITKEDVVWNEVCPLLGVTLTYGTDRKDMCGVSLDRIDSSKGYIKGNVQTLSRKANMMKSNATEEELIIFAKNILKTYDQ